MKLKIKKMHPEAILPTRATEGSAGYDLYALLDVPVTIEPGALVKVRTGVAIALESADYAAFLFARSGLGVKHGICLSNGVGVVDSDYRGEIMVGLCNVSDQSYTIQSGERIAQMVIMPLQLPQLYQVEMLDETNRGADGFGSSGK